MVMASCTACTAGKQGCRMASPTRLSREQGRYVVCPRCLTAGDCCCCHLCVLHQARAAHKEAQSSRQMGRARNAMEDAFSRAAASGGAITLRSANKRPAAGQPGDGECGSGELTGN
jgi:hypothetical protein